ncbi:MAG: hypothetical protein PF480_10715 [Roseovarius sp.]|nr:hypothetical protein [Roseovarius sp.]
MRFFRLTRMAHILSLVVLMVAAVPFVASDASAPQDSQHRMAVMDVRDCGTHADMDGTDATCPGMMLHCVAVLELDRTTSETRVIVVEL